MASLELKLYPMTTSTVFLHHLPTPSQDGVLGALFVHHMRYVVLRYHTQMYIILCSQCLSSITYFSPSVKEHGVCAV